MASLILYLLALAAAAGGAVLLWVGLRELTQSVMAIRWPHVIGVVSRAEVLADSRRRTGDDYQAVHRELRPNIVYQYSVNGKGYVNSRIGFGAVQTTNAGWVARHMRGLGEEGSSVRVYYNPVSPSESVLRRRPMLGTIWLVATGLVFEFGALGAALLAPWLTS